MNNEYPILPHISYGIVDEGEGFYISLPFKGISINQFRRMHHGNIKQLKGQYKSIIDVIIIASFKKNYVSNFNDWGLSLSRELFSDKIEIEWYITFIDVKKKHDVGNYNQKILLDSIVLTNIIKDDDEDHIFKESVRFGLKGYDSITCLMKGKIHKPMLLKSVKSVLYNSLLEAVGIKNGNE